MRRAIRLTFGALLFVGLMGATPALAEQTCKERYNACVRYCDKQVNPARCRGFCGEAFSKSGNGKFCVQYGTKCSACKP